VPSPSHPVSRCCPTTIHICGTHPVLKAYTTQSKNARSVHERGSQAFVRRTLNRSVARPNTVGCLHPQIKNVVSPSTRRRKLKRNVHCTPKIRIRHLHTRMILIRHIEVHVIVREPGVTARSARLLGLGCWLCFSAWKMSISGILCVRIRRGQDRSLGMSRRCVAHWWGDRGGGRR
jgi:hypothetical protein